MKYFVVILALIITLPAFAFEDCVIMTKGKLTDIKIQYNDIIDVFPLVTVGNDKNTLIVHPLKQGSSKFTVLKNNKEKYLFNVKITDEGTKIDDVSGFEVYTIDCPPGTYEYYFDLDKPPFIENNDFIKDLDSPPMLRGEK